jgi:cobaltochelatase CobS
MLENETVAINGNTYTVAQINAMDRASLRTIARILQETKFPDVSRSWIGSMASTNDLRDFVLGKPVNADHTGTLNGSAHSANGDAASLLAAAIQAIQADSNGKVSREEFAALHEVIDERCNSLKSEFETLVANRPATQVEIKLPSGEVRSVGRQHALFPTLAKLLGVRENVWIVGPAGSGKSTALHAAAEALGLAYGAISVCAQTPVSAFLGYMDANGNYVSTEFRRRYEEGGLFNIDEIDKGNANVLAVLNSALANGECAFPDRMVKRHETNVIAGTANTFGTGANRLYVGSLQIDAATLDRFAFLEWGYDEDFEREIAGNDAWVATVQGYRRNAEANSVRTVISPRASIKGARLLAAGFTQSEVEDLLIFRGCDEATIAKIKG